MKCCANLPYDSSRIRAETNSYIGRQLVDGGKAQQGSGCGRVRREKGWSQGQTIRQILFFGVAFVPRSNCAKNPLVHSGARETCWNSTYKPNHRQ